MAVQLASDEVYVATGEPWRRWFDKWSWKRNRELAHACGWEGTAMETGNHVNEEEAARLAGALLGRWRSSS
jgi:hypothetical protein